jgi:hypothetical protein
VEPSGHTLQSIVSAYEAKGALALLDFRERPALVHCNASSKPDAWGFETRAVVAPWGTRVALALARGGKMGDMEMLEKAGAVFPVAKRPGGPFPDRIGVGRSRTADISLRLSSVSKYHAYFTFDEREQRWLLWDARSRNGTSVGRTRVEPTAGVPLENGVDIHFGEDAFLFFTDAGFAKLVQNLAQSGPKR